MYVSNVNNSIVSLDRDILKLVLDTKVECCMTMYSREVTDKTFADIKDGIIISYGSNISLLEVQLVPSKYMDEVKSSSKLKMLNTISGIPVMPSTRHMMIAAVNSVR